MAQMRSILVSFIVLALLAGACGSSGPVATSAATAAPATDAATATPTEAPTAAPSGPKAMSICHEGQVCPVNAGDYVTPSPEGFWPGLSISIGSGWVSGEQDTGELKLYQAAHEDDLLLFWRDVVALTSSTGGNGLSGISRVPGVGQSPEALVAYFTSNSDYKVVTAPAAMTTAGGLQGTVLTMTTSKTADFGDSDCPDNPRCAAFIRDERHWGTEFYAIGGDEVSRMFLTSVTVDGKSHTLIITLDAPNAAELDSFAKVAQPIIDSVVLPATFVDN